MSTIGEPVDVHGSDQPTTSDSSLTHTTRWCSECEPPECQVAVVYCIVCNSALCHRCDTVVVHTSKTTSKHTRMPIDEYLMMDRAKGSSSPTDDEMDADEKNKFCFFSPIDHRIHLEPRLASLVKDPQARPSLVAFIGPTGVGKSFLLRLLISLDGEKVASNIPLAGAPNDANSTSADLHMYAGRHEEYPLLYVDSEGRGGSKEPLAIQKMWNRLNSYYSSSGNDDTKKKANSDEFRSLRFNHVQISYPRMLYIFSDVLCFVFSGNWRERDSILKPLLEWGKAAADGAANQHRPQLILIFNQTGEEALLPEYDDFGKTYQKWVEGDKNNDSDTTLRLYYSDPLVIVIPRMEIDRPTVMNRVKMLGQKIIQSTTSIRESRKKVNQLFTRRELHLSMQLAAKTFSVKPDEPFDIYKASMARRRPNSGDLAGHIIQFHMAVCEKNEQCGKSPGESFRISLSILQRRIEWSLLLWIDRLAIEVPLGANLPKDLEATLELAQTAIDNDMPCGAVNKFTGEKCASLRNGHAHMHCAGKERWPGGFTPIPQLQHAANNCRLVNLARDALEKTTNIDSSLRMQNIRKELSKERQQEHDKYPWLKSVIFYQVCASCMVDVPTEVLTCGHVICAFCAKEEMHGTKEAEMNSSKVIVNLTCPVCLNPAQWYSKDLPPLAGYRILSLDGGGVRGIVELLLLQEIMSYFPNMHVEDLFDIIVGTSTGGIIALALTVHALDEKPKRIPDVIKLFKRFCEDIFSKEMLRPGAQYKIILRLLQLLRVYNEKYDNKALLKHLKQHLGEESLLRSCVGGPHVIVTACDLYEELASAWFTSYNRLETLEDESTDKESQQASVDTDKSQWPSNELLGPVFNDDFSAATSKSQRLPSKRVGPTIGRVSNNHVFSAADVGAATSAAGTFFPPYEAGGRFWVDGGFRMNGPANIAIREAQLLWPTRKASALISLGCGQLDKQERTRHPASLIQILNIVVDIAMDAQKQCNEVIEWLQRLQPDSPSCGLRISPSVPLHKGEVCELDRADKIPFLEKETTNYLGSMEGRAYVEEAANLLFAALFYLHVETNQETQQPDLDNLCIRSRSSLPRYLQDALKAASRSEPPPFSVTIMPEVIGVKVGFAWDECKWDQDVMNLPFRFSVLPLAVRHNSQLKVMVKLHMCLPNTNKNLPLPISGMPCTLGQEN